MGEREPVDRRHSVVWDTGTVALAARIVAPLGVRRCPIGRFQTQVVFWGRWWSLVGFSDGFYIAEVRPWLKSSIHWRWVTGTPKSRSDIGKRAGSSRQSFVFSSFLSGDVSSWRLSRSTRLSAPLVWRSFRRESYILLCVLEPSKHARQNVAAEWVSHRLLHRLWNVVFSCSQ